MQQTNSTHNRYNQHRQPETGPILHIHHRGEVIAHASGLASQAFANMVPAGLEHKPDLFQSRFQQMAAPVVGQQVNPSSAMPSEFGRATGQKAVYHQPPVYEIKPEQPKQENAGLTMSQEVLDANFDQLAANSDIDFAQILHDVNTNSHPSQELIDDIEKTASQ